LADEIKRQLTQLDYQLMGEDHPKILPTDEIYFWREYTSGKNWSFSTTNQLINNLKKPPSRPANQLYYKNKVINECASLLSGAISDGWKDFAIFVPIPGSKAHDHPDHDDRMVKVLQRVRPAKPLNVLSLIVNTETHTAAHECADGERPTVEQLRDWWTIDDTIAPENPQFIAIVDDMLTAGVHYRAAADMLRERYPDAAIVGLFIARRVFPEPDFPDIV
jgi:hypothetical protein